MHEDIERVLITRSMIQRRIAQLATVIANRYKDGLVVVPIMSGSIIFVADLIRQLPMKMRVDLISVFSYNVTKNHKPMLHKDIGTQLKDKDVLIVDDILDTGDTLKFVKERLSLCCPASLGTCVLLNKTEQFSDFSGFFVEKDDFVVGYGLDYDGYYRNLPYIAVLKKELQDAVH